MFCGLEKCLLTRCEKCKQKTTLSSGIVWGKNNERANLDEVIRIYDPKKDAPFLIHHSGRLQLWWSGLINDRAWWWQKVSLFLVGMCFQSRGSTRTARQTVETSTEPTRQAAWVQSNRILIMMMIGNYSPSKLQLSISSSQPSGGFSLWSVYFSNLAEWTRLSRWLFSSGQQSAVGALEKFCVLFSPWWEVNLASHQTKKKTIPVLVRLTPSCFRWNPN